MKNILTAFIITLATLPVIQAQQQFQNTQFMYYKLGYNPAYAGSQESPCISAIYRQQWLGLDGAPATMALTFNMPLMNQRVGVGANLYRQTIGITNIYNLDGVYAYRTRLGHGMLGIGVMGSIRSMEQDFQLTTATQPKPEDPSIPDGTVDKFLFNFGAGLYYNSENFYLGLSVPRLLENNIDFASADVFISREVQHVYLMGGLVLPVNDQLKFQPQAMLKYVGKAPVDLDGNVNLIIQDRYIVGITYRLGGNKSSGVGESLDILLAAQLTNNLLFGVSYDYTLSDLKDYSTGSIEASVHYCIGKAGKGKDYVNPRFF
ncbi:MAG: type IX secretion system membrane protein PorP/SprF [Saprospiraceae bacterium]|nr:MAG: type IX secretion system membrane protein PorP/SprF [Saprospiraceae bacterium]